jgi:PPK2 family polyphosphate:nucleotide phosphotransferase
MKFPSIPQDKKIDLRKWDPSQKELFPAGKEEAQIELNKLSLRIADLQKCLYAEHKHKVLFVLQGMDTSGKNGTIRNVFQSVSPQGVIIASFNKPSQLELDHDYLWRVHAQTPAKGEIVLFDRSHYEDITAVRVNKLMPKAVWSKRFDHIKAFEKILSDEGTTIVKFFLHIDKEEQKERLLSRLKESEKRWKFDPSDLVARELWKEYIDAYEEVLERTNTAYAPWYIIPSNHRWLRNLIVAHIIVKTLEDLKMSYPQASMPLDKIVID